MQFKHPEILYALFLLLIPIIIHLFQLRKFQKVDFTNVAFLKEATLQTRKSSQIKKWLILFTRMLLLAAIIIAFAQPYRSKLTDIKAKSETVIYLDNSFSMQAKGDQGELLKRAVQDLISNVPEDEPITLFTNDDIFKNTSIKAIKNELLQIDYSATSLPLDAALLKMNSQFAKRNDNLRHLVLISDFQDNNSNTLEIDSISNVNFVKLEPVNRFNISIDSAYISSTNASNLELSVQLKNNGEIIENLPVSLYDEDKLIAKTSVKLEGTETTTFSLPINTAINGKIVIDDSALQFDNTLYFNLNLNEKTNVLSINNTNDSFLKRIYTDDEFYYSSFSPNQLNYNIISDQKLIVLNELDQIPNALSSTLKAFMEDGGTLLIIPSENANTSSYNELLGSSGISINDLIFSEKKITTINYSHPLYNNGVFEKQVENFQYPKVNSYFPLKSGNASSVLKFENGSAFLHQKESLFIFSSALNDDNSNFKNSPLIVPTLYNIGKFSLKIPQLYFTIGEENTFDIPIHFQQDHILSLVNNENNIIPRQQQYNSKVVVTTSETPNNAGIYSVSSKDQSFVNVSYNYNRKESNMAYRSLEDFTNVSVHNTISNVFNKIKSDTKINALWKWFVIFALILLITEMLILKFFK